jgi:hypothetical protein
VSISEAKLRERLGYNHIQYFGCQGTLRDIKKVKIVKQSRFSREIRVCLKITRLLARVSLPLIIRHSKGLVHQRSCKGFIVIVSASSIPNFTLVDMFHVHASIKKLRCQE